MRNLKAAFALLVVAMAATSVARAEPVLIPNSYVVPVADWEPFIVAKKQLANHVILSPPLATGTRASQLCPQTRAHLQAEPNGRKSLTKRLRFTVVNQDHIELVKLGTGSPANFLL